MYDRGGEKAIKEGGAGGSGSFTSPMDIFDLFFGGGSRMQRERKGTQIIDTTMTLWWFVKFVICAYFRFECLDSHCDV